MMGAMKFLQRPDGRKAAQLRPFTWQWDIAPNATASILLSCGRTQVICAASVEEDVPRWKKSQKVPGGWLTAEYSMLPYSTEERKARDISRGKIDGRSSEIQRLIGRALRTAVDLELLGARTIWVDCDVLAADGGTRTTAITGAWLAIKLAVERLTRKGLLDKNPLVRQVAATSVGVWQGKPILDLCYIEDRDAEADMNVVCTSKGELVEVQASGEESVIPARTFNELLALAATGGKKVLQHQNAAWRARPKS